MLMHSKAVYANSLKQLGVERNLVTLGLQELVGHVKLFSLKYLDVNLNQVEWDDSCLKKMGYTEVDRFKQKKLVGDKIVSVTAVEI